MATDSQLLRAILKVLWAQYNDTVMHNDEHDSIQKILDEEKNYGV